VCLFQPERRLLISGDHLLGRISLYYDYGYTPDPVGEFLHSLDGVEAFPDVLPSGTRVDARRDLPVLSISSSTPRRRSATTRTSTARQSTGTAVTR